MFSLIGIFTLMTVAAARPGILQSQTSLETIGSIVNHIPTAITHQSRTEIHNQQPVISSIIAPVLRTIPAVQTILQQTPIISSSQIQSPTSALLDGDQEQTLTSSQGTIIGGQASILDDQSAILQNQASLIGGQSIIVGDNTELIDNGASIINAQNSIIGNSGILTNGINTSGLQLNGIKGLSR